MKLGEVVPMPIIDVIRAKVAMVDKVAKAVKIQQAAGEKRVAAERKRHQDKGKKLQAKIKTEFRAKKAKGGIATMNSSRFEAHLSGVLNRMRARNASEEAIRAATSRIKARRV